jgi:hypothetical protein
VHLFPCVAPLYKRVDFTFLGDVMTVALANIRYTCSRKFWGFLRQFGEGDLPMVADARTAAEGAVCRSHVPVQTSPAGVPGGIPSRAGIALFGEVPPGFGEVPPGFGEVPPG